MEGTVNYIFIKALTRFRVFTVEQAKELGKELGIPANTINARLYRLNKKGVINRLMKGLYCLAPEYLKGIPIHEFEIGLALASPSAIAYLSAYNFHNLTDQISNIIYVMAPVDPSKTYSKNLYKIKGVRYRIIRVQDDHFFGFEKKWVGHEPFMITDLERTLIDGLVKPKYCGGFREVLHAYTLSIDSIDIPKIISYAQRISDATCKRLGWVLSHLGIDDQQLKPLLKRTTTSYSSLNPSGVLTGPLNKRWLLQENL